MFVSRLIQRFKGSKGHVARVILGHTTKRPGHEDGTVTQSTHRIDAVQAPTCLPLRINPRAVFINPCEEEINAETGIIAGISDDITVEFHALFEHTADHHATVR